MKRILQKIFSSAWIVGIFSTIMLTYMFVLVAETISSAPKNNQPLVALEVVIIVWFGMALGVLILGPFFDWLWKENNGKRKH